MTDEMSWDLRHKSIFAFGCWRPFVWIWKHIRAIDICKLSFASRWEWVFNLFYIVFRNHEVLPNSRISCANVNCVNEGSNCTPNLAWT